MVLEWHPLEGPDRKATLKKRVVTIPPVQATKLYEVDGRKVGYIVFRTFVEPSVAALDESFTALRDAGATELVLDLRYNGGGLVSVAQHLASLIGGERTNGKVLAEYVHNDRHRELNSKLLFQPKPNALNLTRLVVITTRASASASELIINGLRPYIPVVVVGDRTYGKPVGQYGLPFCDKVLNAVSFVLKNSQGEADYFTGLPATCPAGDALERQLGDVEEASLKEAFVYLRTRRVHAAAVRRFRRRRPAPAASARPCSRPTAGSSCWARSKRALVTDRLCGSRRRPRRDRPPPRVCRLRVPSPPPGPSRVPCSARSASVPASCRPAPARASSAAPSRSPSCAVAIGHPGDATLGTVRPSGWPSSSSPSPRRCCRSAPGSRPRRRRRSTT